VDGKDMNGNASRDRPVDRVTVAEAAEMMGVTQSAIRKRVHRGTIPWEKDGEGRIYVYVDLSEMSIETRGGKARDTSAGQSREELLEAYRDQVEFLRRELERKDTIIMSLTQRIPELEAS
jgi:excisionase family DNA binding protein